MKREGPVGGGGERTAGVIGSKYVCTCMKILLNSYRLIKLEVRIGKPSHGEPSLNCWCDIEVSVRDLLVYFTPGHQFKPSTIGK